MENKRGLSAVVTSLLIILLVLVAVGVVWAVVRNVINTGAGGVELGAKCLNVEIRATAVNGCTGADPDVCDVTLERTGSGSDPISGVKMVFKDADGVGSSVIDEDENIEQLGTKKVLAVPTGLTTPTSVEVTVYFEDESGNEQLCPQPSTYTF